MIRTKINGDSLGISRMPVTKQSLFIVQVIYLHPRKIYTALQNYSFFTSIAIRIPELRKWWKLRMLHGPGIPRVESIDLAVSRRNSILYMTGHNTHDLFSINLERIRTDEVLRTAALHVRAKSSHFSVLFTVSNALHFCIFLRKFKGNKNADAIASTN